MFKQMKPHRVQPFLFSYFESFFLLKLCCSTAEGAVSFVSANNSQYKAPLWERLLWDHASLCTPRVIFDLVFLCRSVNVIYIFIFPWVESIIPYSIFFFFSVFYHLRLHQLFLSVVWNFDSFTFWASKYPNIRFSF